MTWQYRGGQHWAVVGQRRAALLLDPSALGLAERVWALMADDAGDIDAVVEALAREGLAHLPPFALVECGEDSVRVLVRGGAQVRLRTAGTVEERVVDARGFRSWREEVVASVAGVLLSDSAAAEGSDPGPHLPLQGGIVRAADLSLAVDAAMEVPGAERVEPLVVPAPEPVAADPVVPTPDDSVPATPAPVDAGLTLDEAAYDAESGSTHAADEPPAVEPAIPVVPEGCADEGRSPADDDYLEWISGATRLGSVEDAAVRERADDEVDAAPAPVPAPAAPPLPPPPAYPPATTESPVAAPAPARTPLTDRAAHPWPGAAAPQTVISSIPFATGRPAASPSSPLGTAPRPDVATPSNHDATPQCADEEAELTIARIAADDGGSHSSGSPRAGWLPAVVCSQGHANPPESERCRVCGSDLIAAEHRWVERPTIGLLRFPGAPGTVTLTGRPVVIGRAPRVNGVSGDAVPDLVVVPNASGDISRSHVRVEVQGWHVMVVDLHARNGTVVVDPNGESRRLHPGEEKMIVPGARVVLSDDVDFVFEALA